MDGPGSETPIGCLEKQLCYIIDIHILSSTHIYRNQPNIVGVKDWCYDLTCILCNILRSANRIPKELTVSIYSFQAENKQLSRLWLDILTRILLSSIDELQSYHQLCCNSFFTSLFYIHNYSNHRQDEGIECSLCNDLCYLCGSRARTSQWSRWEHSWKETNCTSSSKLEKWLDIIG